MGHPAQISLTERLRGVEAEIAAGRAESALPRCQEIATLYPRALAVQRVLGEIYLAMHKPREALAALDRALAGDPEDARACCARAIIHQMHGDQLAALAWYRRACDIRPEDPTLRATYGEMAIKLGQPPYQPGRVGLARTYLRGDLFTHAIREWETLIAENADSARLEAHVGLVETLWRAGRVRDAENWARRTLTNAPSCLKPLLIAAVIAHDEGRDADAEPFLRRAADLDPDHRMARTLFADRLGAGDSALVTLIWGETPFDPSGSGGSGSAAPWASALQDAAPSAVQRATQPAARRVNRPLVTGGAVNTGSLSRPDLTAPPAAPLPPPTTRPNDLPANFRSMFKETEGMLWDPGESDPNALRGSGAAARQDARERDTRAAPPFEPQGAPLSPPLDAMTPPPAIAESGFALGDTEMRRAIRWVQWLQAQGARSLGDEPQRSRPTGSLDALLNSPAGVSHPGRDDARQSFAPPPPPVAPLPSQPSQPSQPSEPLLPPLLPPSPPSSEDLRQMFAELEPPVIVDASPPVWPEALADALNSPDDGPHDEWESGQARVTGGPAARVEEPLAPLFPPDAPASYPSPAPASYPSPASDSTPDATPDATIEEMERQRAADGFTPFTLEPGSLAALAGSAAPERESGRGDGWLEAPAPEAPPPTLPREEPPAALSAAPEPYPELYPEPYPDARPAPPRETLPSEPLLEPLAEPPVAPPAASLEVSLPVGPDPHDYAARLEQARGHRDSGALDEAIVEYRTVVRNAPALLPDVLADVEGCLADRPEHPELHRLLGDARIRQGDYLGALESYNRAVALTQTLDT